MWINSPLGRWEMKERTRRASHQEQLGRWRRQVEDAKTTPGRPRPIVQALTGLLGLRLTRRTV
jgi:hypothetical protein